MKEVYDSYIEIFFDRKNSKLARHFGIKQKQFKEHSCEWRMLDQICKRVQNDEWIEFEVNLAQGFNCDFSLLYRIFGIDLIGFLFDKPWVPRTTIDPFDSVEFLERLALLEEAAREP